MTGQWLFVKWAGIVVLISYLALSAAAIWIFRFKSARLLRGVVVPLIVGNFIASGLPWIFQDVVFARVCFVVAQAVYLYGLAILVKDWHGRNDNVFVGAEIRE